MDYKNRLCKAIINQKKTLIDYMENNKINMKLGKNVEEKGKDKLNKNMLH